MTYEEKLAKIIQLLFARTQSGDIEWSSEVGSKKFSTRLGDQKIVIGQFEYLDDDGDPTMDIEVIVYNSKGEKAESIRDTTLTEVMFPVMGYSGWYSYMSALLTSARRQALGTEKAINQLLNSLDVKEDDSF